MWMVHEDGVAPDAAVGGSDFDSDSGDDDGYY